MSKKRGQKKGRTAVNTRAKMLNKSLPRKRRYNAQTVSSAGAGGVQDRTLNSFVPVKSINTYYEWQKAVTLYNQEPFAKKLVDIPVYDMLREHWVYKNLEEDKSKAMLALEKKLGLHKALTRGLRQERVLGGAAILMGVADNKELAEPLDISTLKKGSLKFINEIPRNMITSVDFSTSVTSPFYGRPELYYLQGGDVCHASRLLIFDGDPLFKVNNLVINQQQVVRRDGMGESKITLNYDNILRVVGCQQAAFNLVNMASVLLVSSDIESLLEIGNDESSNSINPKYQELESMAAQISMYKAAILQKDAEGVGTDVNTLSATFGGVPELVITFLQVLSAGADIPAVRFLGESPGGLNATGESDLENYYNAIDANQMTTLEPILHPLFDVMYQSLFGESTDIEIEFPPLWNLSEAEHAQVRTSDTQNITGLTSANILNEKQAFEEAVYRKIIASEEVLSEGFDTDLLVQPEEDTADIGGIDDNLDALRNTEA